MSDLPPPVAPVFPTMRAKLRVLSVNLTEYGDEVKFDASYTNTPEDNSFSAATPVAQMTMTVSNPALRDTIKPGQKFYVDFIKAE